MKDTTAVGKIGEKMAIEHLKSKKYQIVSQNYRTRYGEIDLIAKKENKLVFVEVRTKRNEQFGSPEDTLNQKKLKKVWANAQAYIKIKKWPGPGQIDAVCLVLNKDNTLQRINHYENILIVNSGW